MMNAKFRQIPAKISCLRQYHSQFWRGLLKAGRLSDFRLDNVCKHVVLLMVFLFLPAALSAWMITNNPSSGSDYARSMTADSDYIYVAGSAYYITTSTTIVDYQWRIEKRSKSDGALVSGFGTGGVVTSNPSIYYDAASRITSDSDYLYIAGGDSAAGDYDYRWRLEKRNKSDGLLVSGFGTNGVVTVNPTTYDDIGDFCTSIIVDDNYVYTAGIDYSPTASTNWTDSQWRIEKRNKGNGALDGGFGSDGVVTSNPNHSTASRSGAWDEVYSITADDNYLYIAGVQCLNLQIASNYDTWYVSATQEKFRQYPDFIWRIEKRNKSDGSLVSDFGASGVVTSNPSIYRDFTRAIAVDSNYVYIAGIDSTPGFTDHQWRIEKRDITDGSLVSGFGTGGVVTNNPTSYLEGLSSIDVDSEFVYIAGWDFEPGIGDAQWRIEKRDINNGTLVRLMQSNPSSGWDEAYSISIDTSASALYVAGNDYSSGSEYDHQWRIERFDQGTSATAPTLLQATDGGGLVTITTEVYESNDNVCKLRVEYSLDNGNTWTNGDPYIDKGYGVTTTHGSSLLDNTTTYQIYNIITSSGANTIEFKWDTKSASNGTDSLDGADETQVKLRVTPNNGTEDGVGMLNDGSFEIDNLAPAVLTQADITLQPEGEDNTVTVDAAFTETNPGTNKFYIELNNGGYYPPSGQAGDSDTAAPSACAVDAGVVLDGADEVTSVKCVHTDDYGNSTTTENTSPANVYVQPYTPAEPTFDNAAENSISVQVNKHASEAVGLEYCIYENNIENKYVQANGTLGAGVVWQTRAGWGQDDTIRVVGLSPPVSIYRFQTKSRNSRDNLTESDYSTAVFGGTTWSQTTDTDFNAGVSSNTVVEGTGVPAKVVLEGGTAGGFSNSGSGDWSYMKEITITNSGSELYDYQVEVTLSLGTFDYGKCETNGEDIRFADVNETELSYWIETWDTGGDSTVFVKVSTVSNPSSIINIYYGNSSATSSSNGTDTFIFYDDFNDETLDTGLWTWVRESAGDWNEGTSKTDWLMIRTLQDKDLYQTDNDAPVLRAQTDIGSQDIEAVVNIQLDPTTNYQQAGMMIYSDDDNFVKICKVYHTSAGGKAVEFSNELSAVFNRTRIAETAVDLMFKITRQGTTYTGYYSSNSGANWTQIDQFTGLSLLNSYPALTAYAGGTVSVEIDAYFDSIRIRKYVSPEPVATVSTIGYQLYGTLLSPATHPAVISNWDYLSWTEVIASSTDIKIQLATTKDTGTWTFRGPDGSIDTYYTNGAGTNIWSGHGDDDYLKYLAHLSGNGDSTPELEDLSIVYSSIFDSTSPGAITDLSAATGGVGGYVDLTWTAPGNDGNIGDNSAGAVYTVKYATYDVTAGTAIWWNNADEFIQSWTVAPGGSIEEYTVNGLLTGVTYWFAIKTTDEYSNQSGIDEKAESPVTQAQARTLSLPTAPTGVYLDSIDKTSMRLNWTDASDNEAGFRIRRSTYGGSYSVAGTTGTDVEAYTGSGMSGLSSNKQYWYDVCAYNGTGESSYAGQVSTYTHADEPGTPLVSGEYDIVDNYYCDIDLNTGSNPTDTEYAVTPDDGTNWLQGDGTESAIVYWSTNTVWNHTDLNPNTGYSYKAKARNEAGIDTALSAVAGTDTTPMGAPTNLAQERQPEEFRIFLSWQQGIGNESYKIERSTDGQFFSQIDSVLKNTYTDGESENLRAGSTYYYRILGCKDTDTSNPSDVLTAITAVPDNTVLPDEPIVVGEITIDISTDTFKDESYVEVSKLDIEEVGNASGSIPDDKGIIEELVVKLEAFDMYGDIRIEDEFTKEVELKITYTDEEIAGMTESSLRIYVLNGTEWEIVPGDQEVDEAGNTVTAYLEHFSVYSLMGYETDELEILNMVNYPNPMTGETVFTFELTKVADVKLGIYTLSGRLVKSYTETDMKAEYNEIPVDGTWDGKAEGGEQLASGVYFWRLTATTTGTDNVETVSQTEKLVIIR